MNFLRRRFEHVPFCMATYDAKWVRSGVGSSRNLAMALVGALHTRLVVVMDLLPQHHGAAFCGLDLQQWSVTGSRL
jgi:hypothetical protein